MELIIVESPTKATTLSRFLGKDYSVEATMGHIKDLPKSELGIDLKNNFKPQYLIIAKREGTIKKIKNQAKKAKEIFLATDPDREGEAISSHVKDFLLDAKLKEEKIKRIVFHEITQEAVEEAIKNPREIDLHLVNAQVARRVLDRLVGYKLSPLLWRKVRRGLSAGRVQSVTVRLIVEREREIEAFKAQEYWEIYCQLESKKAKKNNLFSVQLIKKDNKLIEIKNSKEAKSIVEDLKKEDYQVFDVRKREVIKSPYPPFTTSTMTQAGARIFGWSAKKTMTIAQRLYEEGLITYHRTDSTNIAQVAIEKVRSFIQKEYGEAYLPEKPRFYKTTSKVAQEAHEAVRPTHLEAKVEGRNGKFGKDEEILYTLIWKRFVACQVNPSIYDETTIDVATLKESYLLRASGQILKFDGWRKIIPAKKDTEEEVIVLPEVEKEEPLTLIKVDSQQKFTEPPARYNEASLIKTLEKLGIGRPSTYAPIISTIRMRNYVEKEEGKFLPTPIGIAVNDFLIGNFPDVFEYKFTAEMEDDLDKIANGEDKWAGIIKTFWDPFEKKLEVVGEKAKRVKIETEKLGKKCPECKEGELVIRIGRFGKFISCSRFPDCRYTEKYLEKVGKKCPECKVGEMIVKKTRTGRNFFGCSRYPECDWASWRKPEEKPQQNK